MSYDQPRRAARRAPSGGLWAEVLETRRALHALDPERETRRPDESGLWLSELFGAVAHLDDATRGRCDDDPRGALLELLAIGSAWVAAMDERGPLE